MSERGLERYEVYGIESEWAWRLRDQGQVIAYGVERYETADAATRAIEEVRTATDEVDAVGETGSPRLAVDRESGGWRWRLESDGETVCRGVQAESETAARDRAHRFGECGPVAEIVYVAGPEPGLAAGPETIAVGEPRWTGVLSEVARGYRHRRAVDRFDVRVVVSGSRGKSSVVRWLDSVLQDRGYRVFSKITGDHPEVRFDGTVFPIDRRGPRTLLYENVELVRRFAARLDGDRPTAAVVENQAISPPTTRLIGRSFYRADVVVITNVRRDHVDTLGETHGDIARAFGRSVGPETDVVCAEQRDVLRRHVVREAERRGASVETVDVPERHRGMVGAETAHAVGLTLTAFDEEPPSEARVESWLADLRPTWTQLPEGRVFDAARTNDVESTEQVRRALAGTETVVPFVYLRPDRRGRTATFAEYVEWLADRELVETVHVAGDTEPFRRNVDVPTVVHDETQTTAEEVLDELLAVGSPVVFMGNTVVTFMRELKRAVAQRGTVTEREQPATNRSVGPADP